MLQSRLHTIALGSLLAACLSIAACDDGGLPSDTTGTSNQGGSGAQGAAGGSGGAGAQGGGGSPDCYDDPKTHAEIINACTDANHIDKQPVLPLVNADGSLPPLP